MSASKYSFVNGNDQNPQVTTAPSVESTPIFTTLKASISLVEVLAFFIYTPKLFRFGYLNRVLRPICRKAYF